jgi:hypothetical protein
MKLQTFFENLRRQRNAVSAFVLCLILASRSFSSVVQCLLEILVRHRIVVLRRVFVFSAKLRKSDAFAFFQRDVDLTTFSFSRLSQLALDSVAMLDDQSVV